MTAEGEPFGDDDRRKSKQQSRKHQQERPGDQQLGQADLDEQAAEQRQHRAALGAGGVVLDIAMARIDDFRRRGGRNLRFARLTFPRHGRPPASFPPSGGAPESKVATQRLDGNSAQIAMTVSMIGTPISAPGMPHSRPQKNMANTTTRGEMESAAPAASGSI